MHIRSKVKITSKCTLITTIDMIKNIGRGASSTTTLSTVRTNARITFTVKGQGHRANELKPFSYKLLVVGSSF